jgi:NAD(P)H-dependent FMN reductase
MNHTTQTPEQATSVAVIIGSTRPERRAPHIARWLMAQLAERDDLSVDLIRPRRA